MAWINPVIGKAPTSTEILADAEKYSEGMVSVVTKALAGGKKYLVGDSLTMADLFIIAAIARGYQFVSYPSEWRNMTRCVVSGTCLSCEEVPINWIV